MRRSRVTLLATPLLLVLVGACGGAADSPEQGSDEDGEVSPLTREEIREHAEAMSPATAESLGIVDTTISIEAPVAADSLRRLGPPADSAPPSP